MFDRFTNDSTRALNTAYFLRLDMVLLTTIVALLGGAMLVFSEYVMVTWVIVQRETFLGAMVAALIGFVIWNYGALQIARDRVEDLALVVAACSVSGCACRIFLSLRTRLPGITWRDVFSYPPSLASRRTVRKKLVG